MRKIGISILVIFISIFIFTPSVHAQEEIALTSQKEEFEIGEEIVLKVELKEVETVAFQCTLHWDNTKLEILSQGENTNVVENQIKYLWYDSTGGKSPKTGEIVQFRFRAKEAGNVHFVLQGEAYDYNGKEMNLTAEKKVQINEIEVIEPEAEDTQRQDNTNLETLAIEDVLLYPPFQASETSYTAEVGNAIDNLKILAVPEQEQAKVQVVGIEDLHEGENVVTVQVTAPGGQQKEYVIRIYKRNTEEEAKYEEEQAQMPEKLKQAYEIEKLSTSHSSEEVPSQEKEETGKESNKWGTVILIAVGATIGVVWYGLEQKKKRK